MILPPSMKILMSPSYRANPVLRYSPASRTRLVSDNECLLSAKSGLTIGCASVDLLDVGQGPRLIEERFGRPIEAEIGEPSFVCVGLNPVRLVTLRRLGTEIDID